MKRYQITDSLGSNFIAGSKAVNDVHQIAKELGFTSMDIYQKFPETSFPAKLMRHSFGHIENLKQWGEVYKTIQTGSVVLLQNPFYTDRYGRERALSHLKTKKNVKFISLIHDINTLRYPSNNNYSDIQHEFTFMLQNSDILIAHNDAMKNYLVNICNIAPERIVVLGIFDYLVNKKADRPSFERSVCIAGNLDVNKAGYIYHLDKIKCNFRLYGPNFSLSNYSNVYYGGAFSPDNIPEKLDSGFGLIWDGNSIDTCTGNTGEYLKYNNPHKLSLYLYSGIPVIIWSRAAEADFVKKNHVGLTIDSLKDLPNILNNIDQKAYDTLVNNTLKISEKLRQGYYTKTALQASIKLVEDL